MRRSGWDKCLENGKNKKISDDVWMISQGSNVRKRICERDEYAMWLSLPMIHNHSGDP